MGKLKARDHDDTSQTKRLSFREEKRAEHSFCDFEDSLSK